MTACLGPAAAVAAAWLWGWCAGMPPAPSLWVCCRRTAAGCALQGSAVGREVERKRGRGWATRPGPTLRGPFGWAPPRMDTGTCVATPSRVRITTPRRSDWKAAAFTDWALARPCACAYPAQVPDHIPSPRLSLEFTTHAALARLCPAQVPDHIPKPDYYFKDGYPAREQESKQQQIGGWGRRQQQGQQHGQWCPVGQRACRER